MQIEYEGARSHLLSRGDRREDIVFDDADRKRFVETLGEAAARAGWQVPYAYCLMRNHFRLVIETPQPTLVKRECNGCSGGITTAPFNARHKLRGMFLSGRYKSIMVDDAEEGYLRGGLVIIPTSIRYRAKIVAEEEPLESCLVDGCPIICRARPRKRPEMVEGGPTYWASMASIKKAPGREGVGPTDG